MISACAFFHRPLATVSAKPTGFALRRSAILIILILCSFFAFSSCKVMESKEKSVEKSYHAYRKAIFSKDLKTLKKMVTKEKRHELEDPNALAVLAMIKEFSPEKAEVTKVEVEGNKAKLLAEAIKDGQTMKGTVTFEFEDGTWKIKKEDWQVSLVSTLGFTWASRMRKLPPPIPRARSRFSAHKGNVRRLAFSADDSRLVSISYDDYYLRLWDVNSAELLDEVKFDDRPTDMVLTPEGDMILVVDAYGRIKSIALEYDRFGGSESFSGRAGTTAKMAINNDGTLIAVTSFNKPTGIWDVRTGKKLKDLSDSSKMRGVAFSPKTDVVAAGSHTNYFRVWNLNAAFSWFASRSYTIDRAGKNSDVWSVVISPNGKYLATGHMDSSVTIWDFESRDELLNTYVEDASTQALAFSSDSTVLASGQQNGFIYFWDTEKAQELTRMKAYAQPISSLVFSNDGQLLVSGGDNGEIVIWHWEM